MTRLTLGSAGRLMIAAGIATAALASSARAALLPNVVFNDTLASNGSTLNATGSPNRTSTNYDVASSKDASASNLTSGSPLKLEMASTSSGINEVQALFTQSPVALSNVGDAVEITTTFVPVAGGINTGSSEAVYLGMYSSGGSAPYNNLYNGSNSATYTPAEPGVTGLNNTYANDNAGGTQNWNGFEADSFGGQATKLYLRGPQSTSSNNADQALVGSAQTGGPTGTQASPYISQNPSTTPALLTAGNTYTDELEITLTSPGTYTVTEALYNGATDTGTQVGTNTSANVTPTTPITTGFDGFSLGYRETGSEASELDLDSVEVTTTVQSPEPASLVAVLLGAGLLARRRRL